MLEDLEDEILQDYQVTSANEINLLNLVDFLNYLKTSTSYGHYLSGDLTTCQEEHFSGDLLMGSYANTGQILNILNRRSATKPSAIIDNQAVTKFNLELFVREYQKATPQKLVTVINTEKAKFKSVIDQVNSARSKIEVINDTDIDHGINFGQCSILEIIIHANYGDRAPDYVDLLKIYDLYHLSEKVPHAKFRGDNPEDSLHKIYKGISSVVGKDELIRWISDKPVGVKTEDSDIVKYPTIFIRGLNYKVKIYDTPDPDNPG